MLMQIAKVLQKTLLSSEIKTVAKLIEKTEKEIFWILFLCSVKTVLQVFSFVVVILEPEISAMF